MPDRVSLLRAAGRAAPFGDLRGSRHRGEPDDRRPALFSADRGRKLAKAGGTQVNVLVTGQPGETLTSLANATGGRASPADSGVAAPLAEIRDHPPVTTAGNDTARTKPTESPDIPIVVALPPRWRWPCGRWWCGNDPATRAAAAGAAVVAAVIVGARVVTLRQITAAGRTRAGPWRWVD